jgi:hypothetical protein
MSLRKSPTLTPARIEANRRNAQKSTGPRTARGKAQVRFNALKTGVHLQPYWDSKSSLAGITREVTENKRTENEGGSEC